MTPHLQQLTDFVLARCYPNEQATARRAIRAAISEEREAAAQTALNVFPTGTYQAVLESVAAAIRARGEADA